MIVNLNAEDTSRYLPFNLLITTLREAFAEGCITPSRHHHAISRPNEPDATLLVMPAWTKPDAERAYCGVKLVTVYPGNVKRGKPGLTSCYNLYNGHTGEQLAIIDGNTITGRRTVAVAALAADYLSRSDSKKLLIVGAGRVASLLADAYRSIRNIEEIKIWDVNSNYAETLAVTLTNCGYNAVVTDTLEAAVRNADIISVATLATTPLIRGEWLQAGTHIDLIGAFTPEMREADDAAMLRSSIFVDTIDALHEAGDLVQPLQKGVLKESALCGTLEGLCQNRIIGRRFLNEITIFKTVGTALADLTAAKLVYEQYTEMCNL